MASILLNLKSICSRQKDKEILNQVACVCSSNLFSIDLAGHATIVRSFSLHREVIAFTRKLCDSQGKVSVYCRYVTNHRFPSWRLIRGKEVFTWTALIKDEYFYNCFVWHKLQFQRPLTYDVYYATLFQHKNAFQSKIDLPLAHRKSKHLIWPLNDLALWVTLTLLTSETRNTRLHWGLDNMYHHT